MSAVTDRIELLHEIAKDRGVDLSGHFPGAPMEALLHYAAKLGIPETVAADLSLPAAEVRRAAPELALT